MLEWTRLEEASFNTVYRVRSSSGGLVVKLAPAPGTPTMTYERDLLRTEALFYRANAAVAPVPRIVHTDFSRRHVPGDLLVMTELPGVTWNSGPKTPRLRAELGGLVAALHRTTGPGFGYPQGPLAPSWRAAFSAMLAAVLADAERFGTALPCRLDDLLAPLSILDEVEQPVLVHFDLWPGNVLVDGHTVTGLIDAERAFWGDPLADLVSVALFGDIERDKDFLRGYREAGGTVTFDEGARRRLALYRCYLYLIMLVEMVPRGRGRPAMVKLVSTHLSRALSALTPRTAS
ncbi:aminoglycoside phosphotransferase family protein [Amycolatopsis sp. NPDC051128]|uniref:aminoglycoside phosphotransferase family protein n=1 Tax=Amycolatopsis sp. NPDC051128 TaxID=3155412 RepID=UPI00343411EE